MNTKTSNPKNVVTYRYVPGAVGDGMPWDNGAVMSREFRQRRSAEKALADLQADEHVQWARLESRA